jgi:hypothetical protein
MNPNFLERNSIAMTKRSHLIALALAAFILVPAAPAAAAMPNWKPDRVIPCGDGNHRKLKVWDSRGEWAINNPCKRWAVVVYGGKGDYSTVSYAPGARAHYKGQAASHTPRWRVYLGEPETCAPRGSWYVPKGWGSNDVTPPTTCGQTPPKQV